MALDPETRRWLREWGVKIGTTAYLLFVFAFMTGHPRPGSMASLAFAVGVAVLPAAIATAGMLGVMIYLRKR